MNPNQPDEYIPCPDCPGIMQLNNKNRYSHVGPHDADCIWRKYEPVNWDSIHSYMHGVWEFDEKGEPKAVEPPASPISAPQFENNVIKVDFKNRKRIE
jgi:hypothetical protein